MSISRLSFSVSTAGIVTLALLTLMAHLIVTDEVSVDKNAPSYTFDFWRIPEPLETPDPKPRPVKPGEVETPPPIPRSGKTPFDITGSKGGFTLPPPVINQNPDGTSLTGQGMMPLVKIAPEYPNRAITAGIEGYVIVEYTVTKIGTVINPRVVDAYPKGYFERAALRAIKRFRYNPHQVQGIAADVHGVMQKFTFELDKKTS